jgi:hypothetical protein
MPPRPAFPASVYGWVWVPAAAAAAWAGARVAGGGLAIRDAVVYADGVRGIDHAAADPAVRYGAGVTVAAVVGAASFEGFRRALVSVMSTGKPRVVLRADVAAREAREAAAAAASPPLTLRRLWTLVGPSATPASIREFSSSHGVGAIAVVLAGTWAVTLAAAAGGQAEGWVSPRTPDFVPYGNQARERQQKRLAEEAKGRRIDGPAPAAGAAAAATAAGRGSAAPSPAAAGHAATAGAPPLALRGIDWASPVMRPVVAYGLAAPSARRAGGGGTAGGGGGAGPPRAGGGPGS